MVALLTAPAFFLVLYDSNHLEPGRRRCSITVIAVVMFRGLVEVVARKLIPSPSLYGADAEPQGRRTSSPAGATGTGAGSSAGCRSTSLIVLVLLALCQVLFAFAGVSAPFFHPFDGLRQIFPPDTLPQLALVFVQLPLLFFVNFAIFFGPFLFFAVRQIRGYEPGDASWGVKIDDVRGQAEAKEEITRVITLWQSGEEFEKAGGKRERGLLFLGAPGTGKTMISKAIATNFNCPFVTIPGSGFAGMFIGMDAITVQFLARKARKLAAQVGRAVHRVHRRDRRRRDAPPGAAAAASAAPAGAEPDLDPRPLLLRPQRRADLDRRPDRSSRARGASGCSPQRAESHRDRLRDVRRPGHRAASSASTRASGWAAAWAAAWRSTSCWS